MEIKATDGFAYAIMIFSTIGLGVFIEQMVKLMIKIKEMW
jgi:hypothetical protein